MLWQRQLLSVVSFAIASVTSLGGCASKPRQQTFNTPQQAVEALHDATRNRDRAALNRIFGPDFEQLASGNKRQDQADFQRFAAAFDRKWDLQKESDGRTYLEVGEQNWEFPAPLVEDHGRWRFDTQRGIEDMDDRRIGQYELDAIRTCDAYVQAQNNYFAMDPDGDSVKAYAQRLRSSPGKYDGLYWPDSPGVPQSPIGPLVGQARARGELDDPSKVVGRQSYRGYYFKVLTRQGPGANGGTKDYIDASGRMTGGFALVAWPAVYGKTGIMSFVVNADGEVFQRNLGPATAEQAERMTTFDTSGWEPLTPAP